MGVTTHARTIVVSALLLCAALSGTASAQRAPTNWQKGTTLALFGGAATASGTRATTGASLGWEIWSHLTVDGSGVWITPRRGASAFAAQLGARVNLTPPSPVVPFVSGGVGLYRANFSNASADVPDFYRRRMVGTTLTERATFDDFMFSLGGGVDIYLRRHLALRPDLRVMFARHDSSTRAVPVYGIHLAYHFEEHVVTP